MRPVPPIARRPWWSAKISRLTAVALVALGGCNSLLDIEQLPSGSGSGISVVFVEPGCATCNAEKCALERANCDGDHACQSLHACVAGCHRDDVACRTTCEIAGPSTATSERFVALDKCIRRQCTDACLGVTGIGAAYGPGCSCLDTACPVETLDCIRSDVEGEGTGDCERTMGCIATRQHNPEGVARCAGDHPYGVDESNAVKACWNATNCPSCSFVPFDFSCARKYRWPLPKATVATVTMHVTTSDGKLTPIAGAQVYACGIVNCGTCDVDGTAVTSATTDAAGDAQLDLPVAGLGYSGCFVTTSKEYVRTILTLGAPIVRSTQIPMFLIPPIYLSGLASLFKSTVLTDRGHLIVLATDCFASFTPGVSMEIDPRDSSTLSGYLIDGKLDTVATATGHGGSMVFFNVLAPSVLLTPRYGAIAPRTVGIPIHPGSLTIHVVYPPVAE